MKVTAIIRTTYRRSAPILRGRARRHIQSLRIPSPITLNVSMGTRTRTRTRIHTHTRTRTCKGHTRATLLRRRAHGLIPIGLRRPATLRSLHPACILARRAHELPQPITSPLRQRRRELPMDPATRKKSSPKATLPTSTRCRATSTRP